MNEQGRRRSDEGRKERAAKPIEFNTISEFSALLRLLEAKSVQTPR